MFRARSPEHVAPEVSKTRLTGTPSLQAIRVTVKSLTVVRVVPLHKSRPSLIFCTLVCAAGLGGFPPQGSGELPPTLDQQQRLLANVRAESVRYQRDFPNLICTQLTRRSIDESGTGKSWKLQDVIEVEDNYVGAFVNHKLLMIDKKAPGKKTYQGLDGFLSEPVLHTLGFLPQWIFSRRSKSRIEWKESSQIESKAVQVYSVRVAPADSQLKIIAGRESVVAGVDGLIYVDPVSAQVLRFEVKMDLPQDSTVEEGFVRIDYGPFTISERNYFLPLKAEVKVHIGPFYRRNEIEVVRYQKYGADVTVRFDSPESIEKE